MIGRPKTPGPKNTTVAIRVQPDAKQEINTACDELQRLLDRLHHGKAHTRGDVLRMALLTGLEVMQARVAGGKAGGEMTTWTEDSPTKPGWYWYRNRMQSERVEVMEVYPDGFDGAMWCRFIGDDTGPVRWMEIAGTSERHFQPIKEPNQ